MLLFASSQVHLLFLMNPPTEGAWGWGGGGVSHFSCLISFAVRAWWWFDTNHVTKRNRGDLNRFLTLNVRWKENESWRKASFFLLLVVDCWLFVLLISLLIRLALPTAASWLMEWLLCTDLFHFAPTLKLSFLLHLLWRQLLIICLFNLAKKWSLQIHFADLQALGQWLRTQVEHKSRYKRK